MSKFGSVGSQVVSMAERKKDPWSEMSEHVPRAEKEARKGDCWSWWMATQGQRGGPSEHMTPAPPIGIEKKNLGISLSP